MPMLNVLTEDERQKLLVALVEAPDEVLIDAVRQFKDWRSQVSKDFKELHAYLGVRVIEAPKANYAPAKPFEEAQQRPEQKDEMPVHASEPPGTATKSIKGDTAAKLKNYLRQPRTAEDVRKHLKAPLEHAINLLRLLWEREIISFDGERYQNSER